MRGWETLGIIGGYEGLLEPRQFRVLDYNALGGLLTRGAASSARQPREILRQTGHGEGRQLPNELFDATRAGMDALGFRPSCPSAATARLSIALQMLEHGIPIVASQDD